MIYKCRSGSECTLTFTTERGLHIHRQACDHYKRHEAAAFSKRKLQAELRKNAVPKDQTRKGKGRGKGKGRDGILKSGSVSLSFELTQYSSLINGAVYRHWFRSHTRHSRLKMCRWTISRVTLQAWGFKMHPRPISHWLYNYLHWHLCPLSLHTAKLDGHCVDIAFQLATKTSSPKDLPLCLQLNHCPPWPQDHLLFPASYYTCAISCVRV